MENQQVSLTLTPLPYSEGYFVNENGEILSNKRGTLKLLARRLHYGRSASPYYRTKLQDVNELAHRPIASYHVGRKLRSSEHVNHINGDTLDNRLCNLEVVTHAENVSHAVVNKLYCSGAAWHKARGRHIV